ncbi:ABC transporter permease [Aquibacillus koreensis]|uniref:ABC transporter permease n=1 Tax=Aquibacillus koreensis TaxID=279446 RepID=A0A9X4AHF5_9BACI|nr:ABC transporter permease [Aquibacillus koreensis]MCT2537096.1 ABC transporter permease [Aquibacillus koreensis]MDC3419921.1 ABC transporter permease [Aquibacillus koreensis]
MDALRFIARRLVLMIPILFGISILTFVISNTIPGDPARLILGPKATPETLSALQEEMGLNDPLYIQYGNYMAGIFQGDLGQSTYSQRPVSEDLVRYFPATFELTMFAMVITLLIGIPFGIISASRKDKIADQITRVFALMGVAMPAFWLGLLFLLFFYLKIGMFPGSGRLDTGMSPPEYITGMYTVDALLTGNWPVFRSAVMHLVLPGITQAAITIGMITRMTRSSMLEVLGSDYIRTAHAKGGSENRVLYGHALRNGVMPVITLLGMAFGHALGGSILVESVFSWPGLGRYAVNAINYLDFPAVMGVTMLIAVMFILVNLIIDTLYFFIDPRLKHD